MQLDHFDALAHATPPQAPRPMLFVLDGVADRANVAHAFRLAGSLCARVWLVETDITPATDRGLRRLSRMQTDHVRWEQIGRREAVERLSQEEVRAIALEISSRSVPYPALSLAPDAPIAIVAGAEREGVSPAMLEACAVHVHVPMAGTGSSLNVAMSLAIVAAHFAWGSADTQER